MLLSLYPHYRYVICKSLRSGIDDVWNYMLAVNTHMCKIKNEMPDHDVQEVY